MCLAKIFQNLRFWFFAFFARALLNIRHFEQRGYYDLCKYFAHLLTKVNESLESL